MCPGVEEVVDLTCEGSESTVVDLTNNDSVLVTTQQYSVCLSVCLCVDAPFVFIQFLLLFIVLPTSIMMMTTMTMIQLVDEGKLICLLWCF